ncbi:MAG: hypothetical protein LKG77_07320 [Lachnospiraceae bacterium]|nr:hypothetical protein [Lachnospiraceae bacterium]MCI1455258.1 hypothetical protein [Lachnospiraceae bacterium]
MMQFDRMTLGRKARELGFVRDTFEKVCRLAAVLNFIQKDALLSNVLALTCRVQKRVSVPERGGQPGSGKCPAQSAGCLQKPFQ